MVAAKEKRRVREEKEERKGRELCNLQAHQFLLLFL